MANKDLKLDPHKIHEDAWWYEVKRGIGVCVHINGVTYTNTIPWRSLRAALKRKDKETFEEGR